MPRWTIFPLLFLSACAAHGVQDRAALLSEASSIGSCEVVDIPAALPAPDELVNVEKLASEIASYWEVQELDPGHVLLSMAYDVDGTNIRRDVIEHATAPFAADTVQKMVFNNLKEIPEEGEEWTARLRIDVEADYTVDLRVGRSEYCAPRPRDSNMERAMRGVHFRAPRTEAGGVRVRTVMVEIVVNPAGRVARAQARSGPPLDTRMQQAIRDHMRQFFFEPARLDGIPTYGIVEVPIRVRGV